jgi:hypothetical protein
VTTTHTDPRNGTDQDHQRKANPRPNPTPSDGKPSSDLSKQVVVTHHHVKLEEFFENLGLPYDPRRTVHVRTCAVCNMGGHDLDQLRGLRLQPSQVHFAPFWGTGFHARRAWLNLTACLGPSLNDPGITEPDQGHGPLVDQEIQADDVDVDAYGRPLPHPEVQSRNSVLRDSVLRSFEEEEPAKLGLATTRDLLEEVACRMEITHRTWRGRRLALACREALANLERRVLDYSTVKPDGPDDRSDASSDYDKPDEPVLATEFDTDPGLAAPAGVFDVEKLDLSRQGWQQCQLGFHAWVSWLPVHRANDPKMPINYYTTWCAREGCDATEQWDCP